jgi:hypothetical protein
MRQQVYIQQHFRRGNAKGAPLRQCGRASLFVNLPGDEMALLIEMVVDLGVN